jgi:hypothetical protein
MSLEVLRQYLEVSQVLTLVAFLAWARQTYTYSTLGQIGLSIYFLDICALNGQIGLKEAIWNAERARREKLAA